MSKRGGWLIGNRLLLTEMHALATGGVGYKVVSRFREFGSCCCLPFLPQLARKILPTSESHFYPISVRIQYPLVDGVLTVSLIAFSVCPSIFIPEMQLNRRRNKPTSNCVLRRQREGGRERVHCCEMSAPHDFFLSPFRDRGPT